jgi:hypothetical protein
MPSQIMPTVNLMKLPDPAARTAKFVNMMNATKQQEANERQAQIAQERLDIDKQRNIREEAQQGPTLTKMEQDNLVQALSIFREGVTDIADGDLAAAEALRADLVARVPPYEKFILPASQWTPEYKFQLKTTAEQEIQKTIATPIASLEVTADGSPRSVQVGGPPGTAFQSPVYDAPETSAPAPQVAPRTPTTPPAAEAPNPFAAGYKPNSAAAPVNSLSLVVDSALETGVMAKADFDKLVRIAKPGSGPKLEAWARQHNITIAPNAPGVTDNQMRGAPANLPSQMAVSPMAYDGKTPPADFAVYRGQPIPSQTAGLAGAPPMQNTMLQTQPRTSTKLQLRNPDMSPIPGSSRVPISRVAAEAQAGRSSPKEEAAKKRATTQVEIEMAPELAKATKSAERTFQLKAEAPKERGVATRLIANIDDRINTIDRLLRNPERRSIVGRFEGNIPYLLQNETQADAQADFDKIKNTDTLTSLVEMKQDSPTGGSPVGNASNSDVLLVARGANALIQTGTLSKFDAELMDIRRQLYNTRANAIKTYTDIYGDVIAADPRLRLTVPTISDRYRRTESSGKTGTPVKTPTSKLSAATRAKYGL